MRIKSVTVRNYRVHREQTARFADTHTLIGGPNECGKSTLVEALHRALFLKSRVAGEIQKGMVSTRFAGIPEVEVNFTVGGVDYHLAKRFSGGSGTTRLTTAGGVTLLGDQAEDRLAALLKVEPVGGGPGIPNRLIQQWSHLWVWQGQSGNDPSEHANLQKKDLVRRLQETGGAAAMTSPLDDRIAARFAAARNDIFIQAGRPKAGSDLDQAEKDALQAQSLLQAAAGRVDKLRQAVRDFEQATQTIASSTTDLQRLNQQREIVEAALARVASLRQQEALQIPEANHAATRVNDLNQIDAQIAGLRRDIQSLQRTLEPGNEALAALAQAFENARGHSGETAQAHDTAANRAGLSRLRRDLVAAWVAQFEKAGRLQELLARNAQVCAHLEQLTRLRAELARLPKVTPAKLRQLQRLESEVAQAEAALKAVAAGIEVLCADAPVRVGDASLAVGQSQVVTEPTEIAVGTSLRLRISPGGGTSLQEARNQARESHRNLRQQLDELGIASVLAAAEADARRTDLSAKIENAETALRGLDAAQLPAALADATDAAATAAADVERRLTQVADAPRPASVAEAKTWLATEQRAVEDAESGEAHARALRDAAATSLAKADTALTQQRQALDEQTRKLAALGAQLSLLTGNHGDDAARAQALSGALAARNSAEALLSVTRQTLTELQPTQLEADQARLKRACDQATETRRAAETGCAVARAALRSDGSDDPEAALASTTARARSAQDHLASVRRKADAIRLLDQLYQDGQRDLAEQLTKPFAERISAYLQCLFGATARATVTLADDGFTGVQLVRPAQDLGATAFDALSGGAQEQVAAAVRLAMAEVLAADHNGALPVVFDDAFAFSDPDRVQKLQRMLDLAASRGLQLIVLTCNPSDYAGLGAKEVILLKEPAPPALQQPLAPAALAEPATAPTEADTDPAQPNTETTTVCTLVTAEQREQYISRLRVLGGSAGNMSLRAALGWDEATYNSVKDNLVAADGLVLGRGRGGSVALPGA
jgi:DNA repair exonuclease SbcCD ATPase subunit